MPYLVKLAQFISFCIEIFAKAKNLSAVRVVELFETYGAIIYLDNGYELLHTQSEQWLVAEMDDFFKVRGVNV